MDTKVENDLIIHIIQASSDGKVNVTPEKYKRVKSLVENEKAKQREEIKKKILELYDDKYWHPTRDYKIQDHFRDDICGRNGILNNLTQTGEKESIL